MKMKKRNKRIGFFLCLILALSLLGCSRQTTDGSLWDSAKYVDDQEFGEGAKTVIVEIEALEKSVHFTIHTDETYLGDALLSHEIIVGEEGPYGLFFEEVNGIVASFEEDNAYWAFYQEGAYMNVGVDGAEITDGDHYELVYTTD